MKHIILFTDIKFYNDALNAVQSKEINLYHCDSLESLEKLITSNNSYLITFGVSDIIPASILKKCITAINIHGASPDYPGRDPHHHAKYNNASIYGATAHFMTEKVDSGAIIDVELFDVANSSTANDLLKKANDCGMIIMSRLINKIADNKKLASTSYQWGKNKTKRSDLIENCKLDAFSPFNTIKQKYDAFQDGVNYKNLYLNLHNLRFNFSNLIPSKNSSDFTWQDYQQILINLLQQYDFITFDLAIKEKKPCVLWRHDVDFSIYNAVTMAQIEHQHNIKATYFLMLGSNFYNPKEQTTLNHIININNLGHEIGLHYDFDYLRKNNTIDLEYFNTSLQKQKQELEDIIEKPIKVFSMHNPAHADKDLIAQIEDNLICQDMLNVYAQAIKNKFTYCSDSNGVWQYQRVHSLIDNKTNPFLHILTHPCWWTMHYMPPRAKIVDIAMQRANNAITEYDNALKAFKRPNIDWDTNI